MKKLLTGIALTGAFLGVAGITASEKNAQCDAVAGMKLEGSNSVYKVGTIPVASYFNYEVKSGNHEISSFTNLSLIFNVEQNSKAGAQMADRFCASGKLSLPTASRDTIIPHLRY